MSQTEDPNLCACRDLITWVKAQPGAASSFLAPNPFGSWLPGKHALHALLDTLTRRTDRVWGLGVPGLIPLRTLSWVCIWITSCTADLYWAVLFDAHL